MSNDGDSLDIRHQIQPQVSVPSTGREEDVAEGEVVKSNIIRFKKAHTLTGASFFWLWYVLSSSSNRKKELLIEAVPFTFSEYTFSQRASS